MSTTVDERVVSMQFDNKHFETNVKTTMSTLDKLKQALNLKGASKGFEEIGSAAGKVDMRGLGNSVETVRAKFSALQVMGVTALANITNSAVNAGKRIVSALTIDPIKTGFNEYELKMDSIKTIVASTGEELKVVNKYLEELNEYSDQTIYSFSDMTQNIGKFTNAGVKLEDAVLAIKGISNEAAVSGANANEASRAMYNFAQALSTGYIQRIDWKSIELANMATMEFKNYLLETAVAAGTVKKNAKGMYTAFGDDKAYNAAQMFTEALDEQWLTSEVLINTLKQYSDPTTEIGKKAFAAAQDVTKLSQMFDVLKETAQSGWAKTWELLFGDLEQAKAIFTPLTNFFSNILNAISDARNNLLEGFLSSPIGKMAEKLANVAKNVKESIEGVAKAAEDYADIVNRVIRGEFGNAREYDENGEDRYAKLTKLGYNYAKVQNLVNEELGCSVRHNEELGEIQGAVSESTDKQNQALKENAEVNAEVADIIKEVIGVQEDSADAQKEIEISTEDTIKILDKLNDTQLESIGITRDEIDVYKKLQDISNRTEIPLEEISGRLLLVESLKNIGQALVGIFEGVRDAFTETFDAIKPVQILNLLDSFHKLTEKIAGPFQSNWSKFLEKLDKSGVSYERFTSAVEETIGTDELKNLIEKHGSLEKAIRSGAIGSDILREALEKLKGPLVDLGLIQDDLAKGAQGEAVKQAQKALKELGYDLGEFGEQADGVDGIFGNMTESAVKAFQEANNLEITGIIDEKTLGLLKESTKQTPIVVEQFENLITTVTKDTDAVDKLKRTFKGVLAIVDVIGTLTGSVFKIIYKVLKAILSMFDLDILGFTAMIGDALVRFRDWVDSLLNIEAVVQPVVGWILEAGKAISEWYASFKSSKGVEDTIQYIKDLGTGIKEWWTSLKDVEDLPKTIAEGIFNFFSNIPTIISTVYSNIKSAFTGGFPAFDQTPFGTFLTKLQNGLKIAGETIKEFGKLVLGKFNEFLSARGMKPISEDMISGFVNGLKDGAIKVYDQIVSFANNIITKVKEVLGIHSPSTVFFAIGGFIIAGLLGGLSAAFPQVREFFGGLFSTIGETFKDFDLSKLFAVLTSAGIVVGLKKLSDVLGSFTSVIGGTGDVLSGVGTVLTKSARSISKVIKASAKVVNNFGKSIKKIGSAIAGNIKAKSFAIRADAIMTIAKAVLMLVAALWLLAQIPTGDLIKAGIALAVVVGAVIALVKTLDKTKKTSLDTAAFTALVMSLAGAVLILAIAMRVLGGMDWKQFGIASLSVVVLGAFIAGLVAITKYGGGPKKMAEVTAMLSVLGKCILMMAIAMRLLGTMDWQQFGIASLSIVVLGGLVTGLIAATKLAGGPQKMAQVTLMLSNLGKCILLMAVAMRLLGTMSWEQFGIASLSVAVLGVLVAGLIWATKLAGGPQRMAQVASMLSVLGTCILYMAIAMRLLGTMDWQQFGIASLSMVVLGGLVTGLIAATKLAGGPTGMKNTTAMLSVLGKCILLMAVGMRLLGTMDWNQFAVATASMVVLGGFIVGLIAATKLCGGGKQLKATGNMLLQISACIAILAVAMRILGGMSWGEFGVAAAGMVLLGRLITGLIAATKLAGGGKQLKQTGVTLLLISAAIAILAGVAVVLGLINLPDLAKGIVAVGILSGLMAMLIAVTSKAKKCKDELIVLTAAIALMAGSIALLSMIDGTKLATATACLGAVMGMFALMILASSKAGKSIGSIIVMTLAVGMMAGMLYLLAQLPVEQTQGSAIALAGLMLAMSGVLVILSVVGKSAKSALKGVIALTAMVVPMAAFCLAIAYLPDISGKKDSILALVTVMGAMILLLVPLAIIGKLAGTSALLGVLALTAMVVPLAAFCLAIAYLPDCTKAVGNAILLTQLMTAMTILLVPLTLIGLLGPAAFIGVLALTAMAIPMVAFVGILALMQNIQNATTNTMLLIAMMNTLSDVLVKIALIAPLAIIGVAALTALTVLMTAMGIFAVTIGALMTKFPKLEEFLNKGLPILEQLAGSLGTMIGKFVAGFVTEVTAALPGIGQSLSDFMTNVMPFIEGAKLVDGSVLEGVGILTASILALTAADLIENVVSFFSGGTSFASLGTELSDFMTNAMSFIEGAKLVDPTAMEGVKMLAEALMIITAADLVDGLTSWLTGGSSLGDFGKQLAPFGEGIRDFSNAVKGIDNESVKVAAEAGLTLARMANEIPNSGGIIGKIFGDNDADAFGEQMSSFGESLAKFSDSVDDGAVDIEAVTAAVESAEKIIEVTKKIPNSGGLLGKIMGDNDADTFGAQMSSFGSSLAEFSGTVDEGAVDIEAVTNACDAANKLVEFSKKIPNSGGLLGEIMGNNDADTFGAKMLAFGSSLAEFSTSIAGGIDLDAVDAFATAFTTLGASGIDQLVEAFTTGTPAIDAALLALIQHTVEQIHLSIPALQEAVAIAIESGVTQIRTGYVGFYSAGDFLTQGFAAGISENTFKPVATARAMALAALQAAKAALGINSPSKEFYEVGYYTIKGFVNAIGDNVGNAEKATTTMADKLKSSFQTAMDKVNNLLSTDIDAQPTIRPILDLSDVSAGARSIGSMFNSPTLAMANIGAISTISAQRQNGVGNGDLLSAIKDLGNNLGKTGNTYSINGINVAEGTEAADVIHSLVRVMKMEGRS